MKSLSTTPVLGLVNNATNVVTAAGITTSQVQMCVQLGVQSGISARVRLVRKQLDGLFTGYSPAFGDKVHEILGRTEGNDAAMLDAWSRIGHKDAQRSPRIDLLRANESTMSPVGVACLISYARGYLDELETIQAATSAAVKAPESSTPTTLTSGSHESDQTPKPPGSSPGRPSCPRKSRTTRP